MAKRIPRPRSTSYPSDVSDEEWAFVGPYLTLNRLDSGHRTHDLRAVFNPMRWLVRTGASWRMMPHDLPQWPAVFWQMQRRMRAGQTGRARSHTIEIELNGTDDRAGIVSEILRSLQRAGAYFIDRLPPDPNCRKSIQSG